MTPGRRRGAVRAGEHRRRPGAGRGAGAHRRRGRAPDARGARLRDPLPDVALGRLRRHRDELYWNVTGNGWALPHPARLGGARAASRREDPAGGAAGVVDRARRAPPPTTARATWDAAAAGAPRRDPPGPGARARGSPCASAFPRASWRPRPRTPRRQWFRMDWGGWIDAGSVLGLVLAPLPRHVVAGGPGPGAGSRGGALRASRGFLSRRDWVHLQRRGWDDALLAAALVSLAVKGTVHIEKEGRTLDAAPRRCPPGRSSREEERRPA